MPTFICGRTATSVFYTYTHLWMYSGLYSATATFSQPFWCTFSNIHAYIHLWTHSDFSILHLHSSVDVQRSLQCYSYIFAAIFVYIFVHPRLHSSVDAQRSLYSTPTLICDVQRSLQCYSYIFAAIFVYIFVHPRLHSSVDAQRSLYSTPTLICGCTAVFTVLQVHFRGLYSATATFSRPFSCIFSYTHAYIHLLTHMSV